MVKSDTSRTTAIINIMNLSGLSTNGLKLVARDDNDFLPVMEKWVDSYLNMDHDTEQEYLALLSSMVAIALKNDGQVVL